MGYILLRRNVIIYFSIIGIVAAILFSYIITFSINSSEEVKCARNTVSHCDDKISTHFYPTSNELTNKLIKEPVAVLDQSDSTSENGDNIPSLPIAYAPSLQTMSLDEVELNGIRSVAMDFKKEIESSQESQYSTNYSKRWDTAVSNANEKLRLILGNDRYNEHSEAMLKNMSSLPSHTIQ